MCDNSALDLRVCSWDTLESSRLSSSHRSAPKTCGLLPMKKTQVFPETFGLIFTLQFSHPLSGACPHCPGTSLSGWKTPTRPRHRGTCRPPALTFWNLGPALPSWFWTAAWLSIPTAICWEAALAPGDRECLLCSSSWINSKRHNFLCSFWYVLYVWHRLSLKGAFTLLFLGINIQNSEIYSKNQASQAMAPQVCLLLDAHLTTSSTHLFSLCSHITNHTLQQCKLTTTFW